MENAKTDQFIGRVRTSGRIFIHFRRDLGPSLLFRLLIKFGQSLQAIEIWDSLIDLPSRTQSLQSRNVRHKQVKWRGGAPAGVKLR